MMMELSHTTAVVVGQIFVGWLCMYIWGDNSAVQSVLAWCGAGCDTGCILVLTLLWEHCSLPVW
jgi:hypothetical protein